MVYSRDEVRNALECGHDNTHMLRSLRFYDATVATLSIQAFTNIVGQTPNKSVCSYLQGLALNRNSVMIIAEPGLYDLISRSNAPRAREFQHWLYFDILPTLRNNPQLVEQINDQAQQLHERDQQLYKQGIQIENLQRELNDARQMGTYYFNSRKKIIQERNIYRNNPHYMLEYYRNLLKTDPTLRPKTIGGFPLIDEPCPGFDKEKYNKVLARIKMCEDMLKGYLD